MGKTILVLVDGMRPDAMKECGNSFFEIMKKKATYCLNTKTISPSITLPCHFSLFYSVPAERHGITTNIYVPMARPLPGIYEQLKKANKKNGIFYNWAELRDLARPGTYEVSYFAELLNNGADKLVMDFAIKSIRERNLDFAFVYLGITDEMGHRFGWMSKEYLDAVDNALNLIKELYEAYPDYNIIVTADHGGHDRSHGTLMEEDMTTPLFLMGKDFEEGKVLNSASIMDIAPTITNLLEAETYKEWEGKSLYQNK